MGSGDLDIFSQDALCQRLPHPEWTHHRLHRDTHTTIMTTAIPNRQPDITSMLKPLCVCPHELLPKHCLHSQLSQGQKYTLSPPPPCQKREKMKTLQTKYTSMHKEQPQ